MDRVLVDQLIDATQRVLASGAIGANGHGNLSIRVPGAEEMYFTSASTLKGMGPRGDRAGRPGRVPDRGAAAADPGCGRGHAHVALPGQR